jgi:disulfide bond formation protein DsbB
MFLITAVLSLIGLAKASKINWLKGVFVIGLIGTLFSLSLSIYELWIVDTTVKGLPACVYGFFFYAAILIAAILGLTTKPNLPMIQPTPPPSTPA